MTTTLRVGAVAAALALTLCGARAGAAEYETPPKTPGAGLGVDAGGGPVVDPTRNVKDLSEAANKRQDDLRGVSEKRLRDAIKAAEKFNDLRDAHVRELMEATAQRLDEEAKLRTEYADRLAAAEAKRIDAIRLVDVNAVESRYRQGEVTAAQLATQLNQTAETARALVASTAATFAASQQQIVNTLSARITTLEQAGYQQVGKQTLQDPAFVTLQQQVGLLAQSRTDLAGAAAGRSDVVGWIVAGLMMLIALGGVAVAFVKRNPPPDVPPRKRR